MTIRDLGDIVLYLGGVAAALAAIGVLLRYVAVRPLKRWIGEQIQEVQARTAAVQRTADEVHAEVKPNSGASLKDAVTRTEGKLDMLAEQFASHLKNHPQ